MAKQPTAQLVPLTIPPAAPEDCTDSGLGGPVCSYVLPPLYLTESQVKTIEQWHNQHIETLKNIEAQKQQPPK